MQVEINKVNKISKEWRFFVTIRKPVNFILNEGLSAFKIVTPQLGEEQCFSCKVYLGYSAPTVKFGK